MENTTTPKKVWTRESIADLLRTNDRAVERAVVAIYDRQTLDEKQSDDTKHDNNVGFSGAHARMGSYYARWVLRGNRLNAFHLARARKMMLKYTRQLAEKANAQ